MLSTGLYSRVTLAFFIEISAKVRGVKEKKHLQRLKLAVASAENMMEGHQLCRVTSLLLQLSVQHVRPFAVNSLNYI